MTGLAKTLALPAENTPTRLPSFPALERTAVMGFNMPASVPIEGADPTKVVLTRDAAFPCWTSGVKVGGRCYGLGSALDMLVTGNAVMSNVAFKVYDDVKQHYNLRTGYAVFPTLNTPEIAHPPFGQDLTQGENPWLFVPDGMELWVCAGQSTPVAVITTFTIRMEIWKGPGDSEIYPFTGIVSVPANANGFSAKVENGIPNADTGRWFRISEVNGTTPSNVTWSPCFAGIISAPIQCTFTAPVTTGSGAFTATPTPDYKALLPLVSAPEFLTSPVPYTDTRLTAVALLLTNVTQVLNKSGTIIAGRVSPQRNQHFGICDQATLTSLHPAEKAWLPLETGLYTYCPPSTDLTFFVDYVLQLFDSSNVCFRLDNTALQNVAYLTMPSGVSGELAATVTTHLEFRTSSALWQLAVSGQTLETLHLAQLGLMSAGFFFENPEHKSLLNRIANGIKRLEPYATPVVQIAKAVHPPTGAVMAAAYNAARAFAAVADRKKKPASGAPKKIVVKAGPQKMVATSARASGITAGGTRRGKRK
jgi:hypothetical protein